jgi:hypothetical protein
MNKTVIMIVLAILSFPGIAAAAQTCSQQRNDCIAGERSRSAYVRGASSCDRAFPICIKTGVWDATSGGPYGRRIVGLVRR